MHFEDSKYYKKIKSYKLELPFGNFYLTEKLVIGELNEGVHFDWKKGETLILEAIDFYGKQAKLVFVSNRINNYSIDPQNYSRLEEKYQLLAASAIVIYNPTTYMNASIEKQFTAKTIKIASSLEEAIEWGLSLNID